MRIVRPLFEDNTSSNTNTAKAVFLVILIFILVLVIVLIISKHQPSTLILSEFFTFQNNTKPNFEDYDTETQGRKKYKWNTTSTGLAEISHFWMNACGWMKANKMREELKLFGEWVAAYYEELNIIGVFGASWPDQTLPWGDHWRPFSVDSTNALAYYLVTKYQDKEISGYATSIISKLITNPQLSLGWPRTTIISAQMLFPWVLTMSTLQHPYLEDEGYIYALKQFEVAADPLLPNSAPGVHIDGSYISATNFYNYGEIESLYNAWFNVQQIIPSVSNTLPDIVDRYRSIMLHPTIPFSSGTYFHKMRTVKAPLYTGSLMTKPLMIMPFMRYIRCFTPTFQFSNRAPQIKVPIYEATNTVTDMGQYTSLSTEVFDMNSREFDIQATGFYKTTGVEELPQITPSPDSDLTPVYLRVFDSNKYRNFAFIDYEEDAAFVLCGSTDFPNIVSPEWKDNTYRVFDKLVAIELKKNKLTIIQKVGYLYDVCSLFVNQHELIAAAKSNSTIAEIDLTTREVTSNVEYLTHGATDIELTFPAYRLDSTSGEGETRRVVVMKKDSEDILQPFIFIPAENDVGQLGFTETILDGTVCSFEFDPVDNQYYHADVSRLHANRKEMILRVEDPTFYIPRNRRQTIVDNLNKCKTLPNLDNKLVMKYIHGLI